MPKCTASAPATSSCERRLVRPANSIPNHSCHIPSRCCVMISNERWKTMVLDKSGFLLVFDLMVRCICCMWRSFLNTCQLEGSLLTRQCNSLSLEAISLPQRGSAHRVKLLCALIGLLSQIVHEDNFWQFHSKRSEWPRRGGSSSGALAKRGLFSEIKWDALGCAHLIS